MTMNIYIIIYIVLIILSLLEIKYKKTTNSIFLYIMFFFWLMGSLRWKTGTDWDSYKDYFCNNDTLANFYFDGYAFETGYIWLNYMIKRISSSYSIFLSICSLINILCFSCVAKKIFGKRPIFAALLFFAIFQGGIFVTRQLMAISLCFLSTLFIIKRQKIPFYICIITASFLHVTSLIYIISYYIYNYKITIKKFILLTITTIIVSTLIHELTISIISLMSNDRVAGKLSFYLNSDEDFGIISLIKGCIKRLLTLPLFFYIAKKNPNNNLYTGFLNIYIIGTLIYLLFAFANMNTFVRMSVYFQLLEIPLLYYSYLLHKKKWLIGYILIFGLMKIISFTSGYYDLYVPFYTIFEDANRVMQ